MLAKVDGLNRQAPRTAAQAFCEDIFEVASEQTRLAGMAKIGSIQCEIWISGSGNASADLLNAFSCTSTKFANPGMGPKLLVASRDDVPVIPSIDWAHPWIQSHSLIPEEVTYPYRVFIDSRTGVTYVYDTRSRVGVVHTRRQVETDMRGMITPFRLIWSWMAQSVGGFVVHASAVKTKYGTAVFAGSSGSGKSTLAIEMALSGSHLICDDCLWIEGTRCFPVFDRAKISNGNSAADALKRRGCDLYRFNTSIESKFFFSASSLNDSATTPSEISHLFFPRIWRSIEIMRISSHSALRQLANDSGRELFGTGTRLLLRCAELCNEVKSSALWVGPSTTSNLEFVYSVLRDAKNSCE